MKNGTFHVLDEYEELSNVMPKTLKYWPTYYTLDEIKDFFRFPMLYDGEHIEIQKETEPKKFGGDIILGKNTQEISVPLNLLKKHAFLCFQGSIQAIY